MTELIWIHRFNANELGLGNRGAFCLVPTDAWTIFPELNQLNNFQEDVNLIFQDNISNVVNYSKPASKTEHRLSLAGMTSFIGEEGSQQPIQPNSIVCFYKNSDGIHFELVGNDSVYATLLSQLSTRRSPNNVITHTVIDESETIVNTSPLPKPFILLAGISGTGKTSFVRQQAKLIGSLEENYQLVSVRPDWHEPSDLLGYISRLNPLGVEFIVTDVVKFMVKAWLHSLASFNVSTADTDGKTVITPIYKNVNDVKPYWLCLDEMNLAPVEQYFADYLSVLETRKWESNNNSYTCDALLSANIFSQLDSYGLTKLRKDLALGGDEFDQAWQYFQQSGICIPYNLMVAGTVNMDETTHGFSRKVIDRALTFDFGEFFPNNYDDFFTPKSQPKALGFAPISSINNATELSHVVADNNGDESIAFLQAVNEVLKGTPFELAFRALNELLVSLYCFVPKDDSDLQSVWDDFLMCKVLPRIEGDEDKLAKDNSDILSMLHKLLKTRLATIWSEEKFRPDLLSKDINDAAAIVMTTCRSKKKIEQMQQKLNTAGFTSYWP
jgi:hypothetical protein